MDIEEETGLLGHTSEYLEAVKVFPLIPHIRKDAMVRVLSSPERVEVVLNFSTGVHRFVGRIISESQY